MLEPYSNIISLSLILICVALIAALLKQVKEKKSALFDLELEKLFSYASIGGFYCWKADGNKDYFSKSLTEIFALKHNIESFDQFASKFEGDKNTLVRMSNDLKVNKRDSFLLNVITKIEGESRNFQCYGNRVNDRKKNIQAIVIWFYDISQYLSKIDQVNEHNHHLRRENRGYLEMLSSISIPIWKRDDELAISYSNNIYKKFLNGDKKKKRNSKPKANETNELDKSLREESESSFKKGKPLHIKKHLVINGDRRFFEIYENEMARGRNSNAPKEIVGYAFDITRQEEIERELQRHISAHADLLESSSSAIAIYGSDTKLKFYNNSFLKLWGFKEDFLNEKPRYSEILDSLRERRLLPEQADFKTFREEQMQLFSNLTSLHNEFFYLPNDKTLRVIVIPHALGGLLFSYEDMTDRVAMERSYNTLMAVQKETLDSLSEAITVFGQDGLLKLYNPAYADMWQDEAKILDNKPTNAQMVELSKELFDYEDSWEDFKKDWIQNPPTNEPITTRIKRTDEKIIDKLAINLPNGDILISYSDVTTIVTAKSHLLERNEALEEADRLKSEFLANVSYELRTPLTTIVGFSEVLEGNHYGQLTQKQQEYVKGINEASTSLMSIINDILDLTSIEAGHMELERRDTDVPSILKYVARLMKGKCLDSKINLTVDCGDTVKNIYVDQRRLKQILFSIIGNSIKFTQKNGNITLGAKNIDDNEVAIWVKDSGVGIAKEDQEKVFDRFFKTKFSISDKKSGTGLGLSVVQNIVKMHQGRIMLESEEGQGTKVTCVFKIDVKNESE